MACVFFFFLVVVDRVGMCLLGGEGECEFAWLRVIRRKREKEIYIEK